MSPKQYEQFIERQRVMVDFNGNPLNFAHLLAAVRTVQLVDENGDPIAVTGPQGPAGDVITEGTPVNAVAAARVLTVGNTPAEGNTVTVTGKTYKFRAVLGAGVAASAVLTNNQTAPANTTTVTVGTSVYRFMDTPAQANDIPTGTASASMLKLFKAITGTGIAGSDYFAGTAAIAIAATALHTSEFVITVTANVVGFAGNLFAKASTTVTMDWDGETAFFTGGIDAQAANDVLIGANAEAAIDNLVLAITAGANIGVKYGTGTTVNALSTAEKVNASTMRATAKIKGTAGNAYDVGKEGADLSWATNAVTLAGGVNGTVGIKGKKLFDTTYEYLCLADNTINDANWTRKANGSIY